MSNLLIGEGGLHLTQPKPDEWAEHLFYLNDSDTMEHLRFLCPEDSGWSEETVRNRLQTFVDGNKTESGIFYDIRESSGKIIGQVGLKDISKKYRCGEFGIIVHKSHWKTLATPFATKTVLGLAFESLHRVSFTTTESNMRAIGMLEKIGAVREGALRQFFPSDSKHFENAVLLSILEAEWANVSKILDSYLDERKS